MAETKTCRHCREPIHEESSPLGGPPLWYHTRTLELGCAEEFQPKTRYAEPAPEPRPVAVGDRILVPMRVSWVSDSDDGVVHAAPDGRLIKEQRYTPGEYEIAPKGDVT
jgi:hypothetical protein